MSCENCLDFYFYFNLYLKFKQKTIDVKEINKQLQFWEKNKIYDKCFDLLLEGKSGMKFDKNKIFRNHENKKLFM